MTDREYQIVDCCFERHGERVLEIFNQAILTSTALYDYSPRTLHQIEQWFAAKAADGWPVIGIESATGELEAFGSFGPFRNFPAYKYTAEHSVYVADAVRGGGRGQAILKQLVTLAERRGLHALIGAIDATNIASCRLHQKLGFSQVGTLPQVGFKFGTWLDLALYQLTLSTPSEPQDG